MHKCGMPAPRGSRGGRGRGQPPRTSPDKPWAWGAAPPAAAAGGRCGSKTVRKKVRSWSVPRVGSVVGDRPRMFPRRQGCSESTARHPTFRAPGGHTAQQLPQQAACSSRVRKCAAKVHKSGATHSPCGARQRSSGADLAIDPRGNVRGAGHARRTSRAGPLVATGSASIGGAHGGTDLPAAARTVPARDASHRGQALGSRPRLGSRAPRCCCRWSVRVQNGRKKSALLVGPSGRVGRWGPSADVSAPAGPLGVDGATSGVWRARRPHQPSTAPAGSLRYQGAQMWGKSAQKWGNSFALRCSPAIERCRSGP